MFNYSWSCFAFRRRHCADMKLSFFWTCSLLTASHGVTNILRMCVSPDLLSDLMQNRSWTQQMSVSDYCWLLA